MRSPAEREAIRVRLAELELANGGRLTPAAVVEDARNTDSPLHNSFQWDETKAAMSHWLEQARVLITSVRVLHKTEKTAVRAVYYVRDPSCSDDEQGYVSTATLRSDSEMAREAVVQEFTRVADLLRRARQIAAALDEQDSVERLLQSVIAERTRIGGPTSHPSSSVFAMGKAVASRADVGNDD